MAKIQTEQLGTLNDLLHNREKQVRQAIAHLSIREVKEERKFTETVTRLKEHLLLNPVTIEEPTIGSYSTIIRKKRGDTYERMINLISVHFPFTGNKELFSYCADNISGEVFSIYTPDLGNVITIRIELERLDKANAVRQAKGELQTTEKFISQNNEQVKSWAKNAETTIESLAFQKRRELVDLYC